MINKSHIKPKILVISGPTRERVDDARFISNYSSGKMGKCLVDVAVDLGFEVYVISGPVSFKYNKGSHVTNVETACEMLQHSLSIFSKVDIAICVAAVSDYRLKEPFIGKIKKDNQKDIVKFSCDLVKNPDILKTLSTNTSKKQVVVGFAAESENLSEYARQKLVSKGCDMICANCISNGQTFGSGISDITIFTKSDTLNLGKIQKIESAEKIINKACELYLEKIQSFQ